LKSAQRQPISILPIRKSPSTPTQKLQRISIMPISEPSPVGNSNSSLGGSTTSTVWPIRDPLRVPKNWSTKKCNQHGIRERQHYEESTHAKSPENFHHANFRTKSSRESEFVVHWRIDNICVANWKGETKSKTTSSPTEHRPPQKCNQNVIRRRRSYEESTIANTKNPENFHHAHFGT
jgi:hypothetical protein